jgi:hypothetical protein
MQYVPQFGRNGAAAYCGCELIALFWGRSRGLFAPELLYALRDGLLFCG